MFGIIRLIIRIAFILLIALLVLAAFTNPDMESFKAEVRKQLNSKIENETNNPALSYIAELGKDFTDKIVDKMVVRKNYYICSIYTVTLPDGSYNYLGAFHCFFPLQEKNPLEELGRDDATQ